MPTDANDQGTSQQSQQTVQPGQGNQPGQTAQPAQGQQAQQTPQAPVTQRPGADNTGVDERTRGILSDLQKERQARQQLQQQFQALQGQLTAEQRRVQALAGVTPQSPEDAELDTVRARIVQLFPALGKLTDEALDRIMGLAESASGIEEATQHHWQAHGRSMLDGVQKAVSDELGADLSERQRKALARAYVAEAESNPEFLKRHEQGDPTLITEFAKAWVEDWFEPMRKQIVTQEVSRRRPVPNGRDRNVQTTPPKAIDFKNPKAVEDAMVDSFRSHGGRFDTNG